MTERPIIFSAPMVRAILDGSKTQTRRIASGVAALHAATGEPLSRLDSAGPRVACPYGKPGDKLWVKETTVNVEDHGYTGPVYMESDDGRSTMDFGLAPAPDDCTEVEPHELKLRPSTRMPKSMARIWLEVTGVRVERLQDISAEDAKAEGVECWRNTETLKGLTACCEHFYAFEDLWKHINGPGSWDANPWVWVIEFRRVEP